MNNLPQTAVSQLQGTNPYHSDNEHPSEPFYLRNFRYNMLHSDLYDAVFLVSLSEVEAKIKDIMIENVDRFQSDKAVEHKFNMFEPPINTGDDALHIVHQFDLLAVQAACHKITASRGQLFDCGISVVDCGPLDDESLQSRLIIYDDKESSENTMFAVFNALGISRFVKTDGYGDE